MERQEDKKRQASTGNRPTSRRLEPPQGIKELCARLLGAQPDDELPILQDDVFGQFLNNSLDKAIGILIPGDVASPRQQPVRQGALLAGAIETVILLPRLAFDRTSVQISLIVLSRNNTGVTFVDATDLGQRTRRELAFEEQDQDKIIQRIKCATSASSPTRNNPNEATPHSVYATNAEIAAKGYTLFVTRYLEEEIYLKNETTLRTIAQGLIRSTVLPSRSFDKHISPEDTNVQYLNVRNLEDGLIAAPLQNLKEPASHYAESLVEDGDLLITKIAPSEGQLKIAVATVRPGQEIVPSSNLYVVRLDPARANPYFIAAFLNSPLGKELLSRASMGGAIQHIALSSLRELPIPLLDMSEQNAMAAQYKKQLEKISQIKSKLAAEKDILAEILDKSFSTIQVEAPIEPPPMEEKPAAAANEPPVAPNDATIKVSEVIDLFEELRGEAVSRQRIHQLKAAGEIKGEGRNYNKRSVLEYLNRPVDKGGRPKKT